MFVDEQLIIKLFKEYREENIIKMNPQVKPDQVPKLVFDFLNDKILETEKEDKEAQQTNSECDTYQTDRSSNHSIRSHISRKSEMIAVFYKDQDQEQDEIYNEEDLE